MENYSTYVNLEFTESGSVTVHIRQFLQIEGGTAMVVNMDGVSLSGTNFASLLYQLKAIENSLLFGTTTTLQEEEQQQQQQEEQENQQEEQQDQSVQVPEKTKPKRAVGTTNKGYMRKRYLSAPPPRATEVKEVNKKKKTTTKKKKKEDFDEYTMSFAQVLHGHIEGIVKSQCVGCVNNKMDHHDLCEDVPGLVDQFYDSALMMMDDAEVQAMMNDNYPNMGKCPPKSVLYADAGWSMRVKEAIRTLF
jgi:hypothetical protein